MTHTKPLTAIYCAIIIQTQLHTQDHRKQFSVVRPSTGEFCGVMAMKVIHVLIFIFVYFLNDLFEYFLLKQLL